jgi:hypothetical protein
MNTQPPIFKRLDILPFNYLTDFAKLKFMHSHHPQHAPQSFSNSWELNTHRNIDHNPR